DAADEIVRILLNVKIPTYTLVKAHAFSAGAIIAFATDHIYMMPGSVIGAATPMMMNPLGGVQEMPKSMEEKVVSGVSALIRSAAQNKKHDPQLAEAMVRKEKEFKIGDKVISPSGELVTLTNTEAEQLVGEDDHPLLSSGTVKDIDELLETIGRSDSKVITLQVTTAERIARVIASLSVILLACGLLGLYIEFKTPGFGVPGIAGIICLVIFFWGHHIAGLAGMEDILIFFLGVALLLVEIFFIPGFGLVGITGVMLMIFGLFSAMLPQIPDLSPISFTGWNVRTPFLVITGALVLTGVVSYVLGPYLPKSRLFKWISLSKSTSRDTGFSASAPTSQWVGLKGKAITQLHPAGAGQFNDQRLDVVTRGEFLEADTAIRVVETHGRRIVVEKDDSV
ncbi:nodulation protein NfeD, partial [Verrucomicrobiota bacterium]